MSNDPRFDLTNHEHQWLQSMAPAGFSLVMNHTRGGPEFLLSTYPQEWQEIYDRRNYIWLDPVLLTAVSSDGDRLWTERKLPDLRGVLREGAKYGLNYGAIFCRTNIYAKSLLSVARSDRDPTADECNELSAWFSNYCDRVFINEELTPQETDIMGSSPAECRIGR